MGCKVCGSDKHYSVSCPHLIIQCKCGATARQAYAMVNEWRAPEKGEGARWVCPICSSIAIKQYNRGFSDARAGHSPSSLKGPYSEGYIRGKSEPL
jgi:hypothetical protein